MKIWSMALVAAAPLVMSGCGAESASTVFTLTSNDPLVSKALPAIRQACPGLDTYASQFKQIRIENNYRTAIVFDIPEAARIPNTYKASGHTCFIEIAPDGSGIFVEKAACKSVCLDQADVPEGQLKLPLVSEKNG
jgi:hypothetical protein